MRTVEDYRDELVTRQHVVKAVDLLNVALAKCHRRRINFGAKCGTDLTFERSRRSELTYCLGEYDSAEPDDFGALDSELDEPPAAGRPAMAHTRSACSVKFREMPADGDDDYDGDSDGEQGRERQHLLVPSTSAKSNASAGSAAAVPPGPPQHQTSGGKVASGGGGGGSTASGRHRSGGSATVEHEAAPLEQEAAAVGSSSSRQPCYSGSSCSGAAAPAAGSSTYSLHAPIPPLALHHASSSPMAGRHEHHGSSSGALLDAAACVATAAGASSALRSAPLPHLRMALPPLLASPVDNGKNAPGGGAGVAGCAAGGGFQWPRLPEGGLIAATSAAAASTGACGSSSISAPLPAMHLPHLRRYTTRGFLPHDAAGSDGGSGSHCYAADASEHSLSVSGAPRGGMAGGEGATRPDPSRRIRAAMMGPGGSQASAPSSPALKTSTHLAFSGAAAGSPPPIRHRGSCYPPQSLECGGGGPATAPHSHISHAGSGGLAAAAGIQRAPTCGGSPHPQLAALPAVPAAAVHFYAPTPLTTHRLSMHQRIMALPAPARLLVLRHQQPWALMLTTARSQSQTGCWWRSVVAPTGAGAAAAAAAAAATADGDFLVSGGGLAALESGGGGSGRGSPLRLGGRKAMAVNALSRDCSRAASHRPCWAPSNSRKRLAVL
eukprot:XP_001699576.1 predicted protein [Chlamydomonas reinhardtii]